jgi:hypothetical protein
MVVLPAPSLLFFSFLYAGVDVARSVVERVIDFEASFQAGRFKVLPGVDTDLDEKRRLHNSLPLILDAVTRHRLTNTHIIM